LGALSCNCHPVLLASQTLPFRRSSPAPFFLLSPMVLFFPGRVRWAFRPVDYPLCSPPFRLGRLCCRSCVRPLAPAAATVLRGPPVGVYSTLTEQHFLMVCWFVFHPPLSFPQFYISTSPPLFWVLCTQCRCRRPETLVFSSLSYCPDGPSHSFQVLLCLHHRTTLLSGHSSVF